MKTCRKLVPTVLRALHGNPRQKPLPVDEPEGVGDLWMPPAWLDDEQREKWRCPRPRAAWAADWDRSRDLHGVGLRLRRV
jgi:hypothetical protein